MGKSWRKRHDAELFMGVLAVGFRVAAAFTTGDDNPFLHATLHGMADDAFGGLLVVIAARYFWERTSD